MESIEVQDVRANSTTAHCIPRQMPRNGILCSHIFDGLNLSFRWPLSEAQGNEHTLKASQYVSYGVFGNILRGDPLQSLLWRRFPVPAWMNASAMLFVGIGE